MMYKTRKINNRRNFTSLHKKQHSKRHNKRHYIKHYIKHYKGGSEQMDDKAANEILKKIEEQNKVFLPGVTDIPVVGPVIDKTVDLIEGASVNLIDKAGDYIGVDIDNPGSIGDKLDDVKQALSSPENIEKLKEIAGDAGKIGEVVVVAFKPAAEKFVATSLPVLTESVDKAVKAGIATGVNLAEDAVGPFIGIPRTILSAATAFNASVNAGSELVKGASEAIQGTQENFNRLMDEAKMHEIPKIPEIPKINTNIPGSLNGGSLKKLQRAAQLVGGRIKKSRNDFLSSNVIMKQYGTAKRRLKTKRVYTARHK